MDLGHCFDLITTLTLKVSMYPEYPYHLNFSQMSVYFNMKYVIDQHKVGHTGEVEYK